MRRFINDAVRLTLRLSPWRARATLGSLPPLREWCGEFFSQAGGPIPFYETGDSADSRASRGVIAYRRLNIRSNVAWSMKPLWNAISPIEEFA